MGLRGRHADGGGLVPRVDGRIGDRGELDVAEGRVDVAIEEVLVAVPGAARQRSSFHLAVGQPGGGVLGEGEAALARRSLARFGGDPLAVLDEPLLLTEPDPSGVQILVGGGGVVALAVGADVGGMDPTATQLTEVAEVAVPWLVRHASEPPSVRLKFD